MLRTPWNYKIQREALGGLSWKILECSSQEKPFLEQLGMLLDVLQSAPGRPPGLHGSIEISCPNAVLQDAVLIARCTRARVNLSDKMLSPLVLELFRSPCKVFVDSSCRFLCPSCRVTPERIGLPSFCLQAAQDPRRVGPAE